MYKMTQTMRWYGPKDPVSLRDIRQAGATGIVSALHQIPNGDIWEIADILERKTIIENAGLTWDVVESVPVHEDIKTQKNNFLEFIENYKQTIKNLSQVGIKTVCYNFMPVLDWTRTKLFYELPNGSTAVRYEALGVAAFDLYILKRIGSKKEYTQQVAADALVYLNNMNDAQKQELIDNITKGLPGSEEGYSIEEFRTKLNTYDGIDIQKLESNLQFFLNEIISVCEDCGVFMAIHPDDPPFPIFGLPRIMSTAHDIERILTGTKSKYNGITFCTGSLGVRADNNLPEIVRKYGDNIHFIHLRSTIRDADGNFTEDNHLEGNVPMFEVVKAILELQQKRKVSLPMRPDHGHQMLDDLLKKTNPGYSAIGRLKGLAEIRGLEMGIAGFLIE